VSRCVIRKGCINTGVAFKSQLLCCDGTRTGAELDGAGEWTAKYPDWCSLIFATPSDGPIKVAKSSAISDASRISHLQAQQYLFITTTAVELA
jgi:hypothetical protein